MKATTFVEVSVGNKSMRIETGLLAQQAQGELLFFTDADKKGIAANGIIFGSYIRMLLITDSAR